MKTQPPYQPKGKLRQSIAATPFIEQMRIVTQPIEFSSYMIYGWGQVTALVKNSTERIDLPQPAPARSLKAE